VLENATQLQVPELLYPHPFGTLYTRQQHTTGLLAHRGSITTIYKQLVKGSWLDHTRCAHTVGASTVNFKEMGQEVAAAVGVTL